MKNVRENTPADGHTVRAARIGLLSGSLGTAGLGGAWQSAAAVRQGASAEAIAEVTSLLAPSDGRR
ncbi:hypothetical protein [Streptomyces sp. NPDC048521]|uniref:hypothetical protein n=1 Tax=Streptomyces sp. NPDC048521 TaxID=3365566 RepID=UPI0037131D74